MHLFDCSVGLVCAIIVFFPKTEKTDQSLSFMRHFWIPVIKQPCILFFSRLNTVTANLLTFIYRSCFQPSNIFAYPFKFYSSCYCFFLKDSTSWTLLKGYFLIHKSYNVLKSIALKNEKLVKQNDVIPSLLCLYVLEVIYCLGKALELIFYVLKDWILPVQLYLYYKPSMIPGNFTK